MPTSVTRLYKSFQPESYELVIDLDRTHMRFSGRVVIKGRKTGRPSQRLTFHAKDLNISRATIVLTDKKGTREIPVKRLNQQKSFHEIRLHTDDMLYPGAYTVTMEFAAPITDGMTGIYPCYFTHDGQDKALLATQFESHHAREAFPCIDEPEAKATYDLTLVAETGVTALANMPVKEQTEKDDKLVTTFETTPRMSSYLLAWAVGDLQSKSGETKNGTEVSIFSTKAHPIDSLDFALGVAIRSIDFFEDYFGFKYPLAKADHIALPDFSSGAMENWGLITYRERVLLAYPGEASQSVKEQISLVIAHETSHQWFGNLVTMKWWDDLWLNESFANMMEYQAIDAMFPDWHIWDSFVAAEALSALRRDATPGVQPVRVEVRHPDEISTLFDPSIVYAKGGRLLNMLKNYIGEEAFRKGLSSYFKRFAYKNTEGSDLWDELGKAAGIDAAGFMNPWLERPGFPVIRIDQAHETVGVSQSHFSDNPDKADPERLWPVPLFSTDKELPELLDTRKITRPGTDELVRLNNGGHGHYIVQYGTETQRAELVQAIRSAKLTNSERLLLLNDASMLARAGYQPYGDVLTLLSAYEDEAGEPVWDMIGLILGETRRFVDGNETLEPKIKAFIRQLIDSQYRRLGWEEQAGEPTADTKLRANILSLGAYAEHPDILTEAGKRFVAYQNNPASLPNEIRSVVFSVPIKQGDTIAFDYLIKLHDDTANSDLKADIAAALTVTRTTDQAAELLSRIKNPKLVKPQDADRWLVYLMRNRYVRQMAWDFMVDEWDWIEKTYSNDKSYDYMPRYAAGSCNTAAQLEAYRNFFEPKLDQVVLKRNIEIGIEEIQNRVNWLACDSGSVEQFFNKR